MKVGNGKNGNLRVGGAPGQGFMADTSPQTQARRARMNANSPWRRAPACSTEKAKQSFDDYQRRTGKPK